MMPLLREFTFIALSQNQFNKLRHNAILLLIAEWTRKLYWSIASKSSLSLKPCLRNRKCNEFFAVTIESDV